MRHRFETLHAKNLIQAGNSESTSYQASKIRINDDKNAPRKNCLVGINVASV
jgi:hypothetical protein